MKIVLVHGHMFNIHTWSKACDLLLAEGIELHLFSQQLIVILIFCSR